MGRRAGGFVLGRKEGGVEDCTLEGADGGGGGFEGSSSEGRDGSGRGRSRRGDSFVGRVRVSKSGSAGGTREAIWTLGPLVGVERPSRISAAGSFGKSVMLIDPIGSATG